jgi:hypothetical protein
MENRNWELSVGLYPGILIGIRSYPQKGYIDHVLYIPFIELCLTIDHLDERKN